MERKSHWETIYQQKAPTEVSWYQERPLKSLEFITAAGVHKDAAILDAGGGASTLVDSLLAEGYQRLWVADISAQSLQKAKARLGARASAVTWIEGDLTTLVFPHQFFDLWHDRAVFHFLTSADDRARYLKTLNDALKPGGHVIMATFAIDGPPKCSGLEVRRYSRESLAQELGTAFQLLNNSDETHQTPFGTTQKFLFTHFVKA
jgi:ubiquinone/menaquinone biosynthesis C-methylase UbiE